MDEEEKMIEIVPAYDRLDDVRTLFSEYIDMLVSIDPAFSIYLKIQHYSEEKDDPSMKYAMPDGRLCIALADGKAVGCIALRKLDEERGGSSRGSMCARHTGSWGLRQRLSNASSQMPRR